MARPRKHRFADTPLVLASTPSRPYSARILLRQLGVADLPLDERRAAVAVWLETNQPIPLLRGSLRNAGLWPD